MKKTSICYFIITLILAIVMAFTGCTKPTELSVGSGQGGSINANYWYEDISKYISNPTTPAAREYIRETIKDSLEEQGYEDAEVEVVYLSPEYIEEVLYNNMKNVYFGYDLDFILSAFGDKNWCFSVDENGETIVREDQLPDNYLKEVIKRVAIGVGVIVICAVVSAATAGTGTPVACFFAGAAKGALIGAVKGAAVGGAIGAVVSRVKNGDWSQVGKDALLGASSGFMFGSIGGALKGGITSSFCFDADTPIKTENGYKRIADIKVGDQVWSYDELGRGYTLSRIIDTSSYIASSTITLSVTGERIICTREHPFLTTQGWTTAGELFQGCSLHGMSADYSIVATESTDIPTTVYSLTVENTHTYLVSHNDIIVHNACGDSAKLSANLVKAGVRKPEDYRTAAHHIVASSSSNADAIASRQILAKFGIDINSAENGVFLAIEKGVEGTTYHCNLHSAAYFKKVFDLLQTANSEAEARQVLTYIGKQLFNGTFI